MSALNVRSVVFYNLYVDGPPTHPEQYLWHRLPYATSRPRLAYRRYLSFSVCMCFCLLADVSLDQTKPLVVGDGLSDKDILAWLHDKLYHSEVEEPRAWAMAVAYIVSCLKMMRKYVRAPTRQPLVWLRGAATYLLLIVTIAKGSIGFFVPSTAESQYGPSKSTFGSHVVVIPWYGQC